MHAIDVTPTGSPGEYEVTVDQPGGTSTHAVRVPPQLREQLGVPPDGEQRLVRESFEFLLEREPVGAILRRFDLDVISGYFPEYPTEIRRRLE